jgi:hypothetical protein
VLIVKQFNDHACFLACLESFLADQTAQVSQRNMCEAFPECCDSGKLTEGTFQLINPECLKTFGRKYGFEANYVKSLPETIAADETIFIIPTDFRAQGSTHCVRFNRFLSRTEIEVMDPNLNRLNANLEYDQWALDNLRHWKCNLLKLRKINLEQNVVP